MAERKAVNKYYPPDWDPTKGSINTHVGQHPLRDRAKKIKQGILVIRFEMPYNIWCGGCNAHIGMGVRYNAEKSKTGKYYSTPIYKFRMKCHLCDNYFEIQTDPQNHDYVILSGARRKEQRWDPKENGQIETEDKATQKKMATDAMYKLEHGNDDQKKGKNAVMNLHQLEDRKESYKDDYLLNKLARNKFRVEKQTLKDKKASDQALLDKSSLDIELVEENEDDIRIAGLMKYSVVESYEEKKNEKRKNICNQPIFCTSTPVNPAKTNSLLSRAVNRYDPFNSINSTPKTTKLLNLGVKSRSKSFIESPGNNSQNVPQNLNCASNKNDNEMHENQISELDRDIHKSAIDEQEVKVVPMSTSISEADGNSSSTGLSVLMSTYSDSESNSSSDV